VGYGIGKVSEGVVCGGTLWDMTWVKCQRVRCVEEEHEATEHRLL